MLAALGIVSGCAKSDPLTPAQFTEEFANQLRISMPALQVEIIKSLQLKLTMAGGKESTSFLDNAYDAYQADPKLKKDIIHTWVQSCMETAIDSQSSEILDRTCIVPVIKDRPWLEEIKKSLEDRGAKKVPENVYEDLNADLIILYAEDSPKNIRYFGPDDLKKAHIDRKELRGLACQNLERLLPKIERQGTNGLYMLTAGGDYEPSLLLFDSIWTGLQKEVNGDVVVAIPTRDLLVVTGSNDRPGIEKLKQIVQQATARGPYQLTTKLFVYHSGQFVEFAE